MYWNRVTIESEQRGLVETRHGHDSREALMAEIVRLRCALYPFTVTLGSLDDPAPRGVYATSSLFPADLGEGGDAGKLAVYEPSTSGFRFVPAISKDLHLQEFEERESLTVMNGPAREDLMDDDVCVLQVHGQWIGAYANCGQVTMGDVRFAVSTMRDAPVVDASSNAGRD